MAFNNITNFITISNKTEYITKMWHNVYPILREQYVIIDRLGIVAPIDALKYAGDLEGLLIHILGIKPEFVLPVMLVNGYEHTQNYDGKQTEFLLVDEAMMHRYLMAAIRTEKQKYKKS